MNRWDWLRYGYENGWCSPPVCAIHDGTPMSEEEQEDDEPCVTVVRFYDDEQMRERVEANHPPSVWRATNLGWDQQQ